MTRVGEPWIMIRDAQMGTEIGLHRDFAPVPLSVGVKLSYFVTHTADGRMQALAAQRA